MERKTDIAYLTDLFTKFNTVNLQLQGNSLNLIKTKLKLLLELNK